MECLQHGFLTNGNLIRFNEELEQEHVQFSETCIEDTNIPFLQMLQCVEPSSAFLPLKEPNNIFQSILQIQTLEPERCLSHETTATENIDQPFIFSSISSSPPAPASRSDLETDPKAARNGTLRERRKRKRTRTPKNKEEEESQRLNHIAVERNRRRQMNEHLISLRSLMPPSYLHRGDQASIVGGAIDFIKELEQLLHSLETAAAGGKRIKAAGDGDDSAPEKLTVSSSPSSSSRACNSSLLSVSTSDDGLTARSSAGGGEATEEIEATVIQNHVNLKVRCQRRGGQRQIVKAIVFLEKLNLTTLHLNITSSSSSSSPDSVFYSFNLKMDDDCKVGSADEIVVAVHEMFKQINGG